MAKMRIKDVEAALATIHQAIADFRADAAAEKAAKGEGATDNPPEFPGKPAAMDSAPNSSGSQWLHELPGFNRLNNLPGRG